jgi:hypothetical protein
MCIIKEKGNSLMAQRYRKKFAVLSFLIVILFARGTCVSACSMWAATGDRSKDSGSLVGQTWDVSQETSGELRLVIPEKGFRYLGLFPLKASAGDYAVAGINDQGLAVFATKADSAVSTKKLKGSSNLVETILTSFVSVDTALAKKDAFTKSRPLFLMLADCSKIAIVQIGSGGRLAVDITENGLSYHTNHYTHKDLLRENERNIDNSLLRQNRLKHLLFNHPQPFTVDDFISVAADRENGPDNSVWRTGRSPKHERTLASWVALLPKNSPPEIYFKMLNPGSNELNYEIKLDKPFWTEGIE